MHMKSSTRCSVMKHLFATRTHMGFEGRNPLSFECQFSFQSDVTICIPTEGFKLFRSASNTTGNHLAVACNVLASVETSVTMMEFSSKNTSRVCLLLEDRVEKTFENFISSVKDIHFFHSRTSVWSCSMTFFTKDVFQNAFVACQFLTSSLCPKFSQDCFVELIAAWTVVYCFSDCSKFNQGLVFFQSLLYI